MRPSILAAAALAAILVVATPARPAAAMTVAAPSQLGAATADATLWQSAAYRCRYRGCGWHRHYWGWPLPGILVRPWLWPRLWWGPHYRHWGWHHRRWHRR